MSSRLPSCGWHPTFEQDIRFPFQAGAPLEGYLTGPLEGSEAAPPYWCWLLTADNEPFIASPLVRVPSGSVHQARFRVRFNIPRWLPDRGWKISFDGDHFVLPPLLLSALRPLQQPPLTLEQAALALLNDEEEATLCRLYGLKLSEGDYLTENDVIPPERRAAFPISDQQLAEFATATGWSARQVSLHIREDSGGFIWQRPGGLFQVVFYTQGRRIHANGGVTTDLTEAARRLLSRRYPWLIQAFPTDAWVLYS